MAKNRQHAKKLSKMNVFIVTFLMNFPFLYNVLHPPLSPPRVFLQPSTSIKPHRDFLICFISILSPLQEDITAKTLAVQHTSLCQPFFSSSWETETVFQRYLCLWSSGQEAHLACYLLSQPQSTGGMTTALPSQQRPPLKSFPCLQTTAVEKGGLLPRPSPYFETAGNFSAMAFANLGNGLAGRSDYGRAGKGQKLKAALHFFIKSRRWQKPAPLLTKSEGLWWHLCHWKGI